MEDHETKLWMLVKKNDKAAFSELFNRLYTLLCLFSKRYTNDMTTAKEIVQDIFIYLWENRYGIKINKSIKAYLLQSVRYNSIRRIKNNAKSNILMNEVPDIQDDKSYNDHLEYAELQNQILKAVDSLPEQCQRVFSMNRFEELSYKEIAGLLNISVKTVEAHISKALRIIREFLNGGILILLML